MTKPKTPDLFEIRILKHPELSKLPIPENPYYLLSDEGFFLYKHTQLGDVVMRDYKKPIGLPKFEYPNGAFTWTAPRIPGTIISQAYSFFKRIYEKYKTEAEVIITMHNDTHEYRLFVPHQRASGGGVKSIYEPTHISRKYTVVGTLHSHCMMPAFHSGTDTGDADDMDGVHFTIGNILNNPPQIVAMVAISKAKWHYNGTEPGTTSHIDHIAELVWDETAAPEWWDNFMYHGEIPEDKPNSFISLTQQHWDEFTGTAIKVHTPQANTPHYGSQVPQPAYNMQYGKATYRWEAGKGWVDKDGNIWNRIPDANKYGPPTNRSLIPVYNRGPATTAGTELSRDFNSRLLSKRERKQLRRDQRIQRDDYYQNNRTPDPRWGSDGELLGNYVKTPEERIIDAMVDKALETNNFTYKDFDEVTLSQWQEVDFWKLFFAQRMADLAEVLELANLEVTYSIKSKNTPIKQVPGQTSVDDHLAGTAGG